MQQNSDNQIRGDGAGTTSGQIGLVFGYKSGAEYWLAVLDMAGSAKICHVSGGVLSVKATQSIAPPTAGAATNVGFNGGWGYSFYLPSYSFGSAGFPSGKIGLYTTVANTAFSHFFSIDEADVRLAGRWINPSLFSVDATKSKLRLPTGSGTLYNPVLLENLRLGKFQATFALTRDSTSSQALACFAFNAADRNSLSYVRISHSGTVFNPDGWNITPTAGPASSVTATHPSNIPTCAVTDTLWCRVQFDGTTLTVKAINTATAPSESTWTSTAACFSSTAFSGGSGLLGFVVQSGIGYIDEVTIKSWNTATSAFDITEHYDNFTVDGSGYATDTLTYDPAGNLTYDGQQVYTWDAWNRLMTIAHAYRDSGGTLQHGQVFDTMVYDGRNRRIQKTVSNTGQWDCNYHYYYTNNWQLIETRNGSSQTLKQHVWGIRYIDELVQIAANSNPSTGNTCTGWFYAMQDANFNVLGLVNSSGPLVERYEYTPYGQRKVLFAAGNTWAGGTSTNDPGCYAIAYASLRYTSNAPYFGLSDFGHQGLMHDEESGSIYNRRRNLRPPFGRFLNRDPLPYRDGTALYEYARTAPTQRRDSSGLTVRINIGESRIRFVENVRDAFQAIIGNCAKLGLNLTFGYVVRPPRSIVRTVVYGTLTYQNEDKTGRCLCDDCWRLLKRAIDGKAQLILSEIGSADTTTYVGTTGGGTNEAISDVLSGPTDPRFPLRPEIMDDGSIVFTKDASYDFGTQIWHEVIGHGLLGLEHPDVPENRYFNGTYYDPNLKIENLGRDCLRRRGFKIHPRAHQYYPPPGFDILKYPSRVDGVYHGAVD